jgi:hypothetical protein
MTVTTARRASARTSKRDSDAVLVAGLTLVATVIALWDLVLLAFAVG